MEAYIQLVLAMIIYGSIGVFVKNIPMDSVTMVLTRTFVGGIFILALLFIKREKVDRGLLKKNLSLLLLSGMSMGASWIFLFKAYEYTTVSMATLTYYLAPVMLLILSPLVLKERLTMNKIIGILAAMVGMVLANGSLVGGIDPRKGLIFGLLSAVFYTLMMVLNKFLQEGLSGLVITFIQLGAAFLVILLYIIFIGRNEYILPDGRGLVYLAILCILHTGIACYLYFSAVQKLAGQSIALCSYIDPLSALVFSALFLGERLGFLQLIGAILILGGAAYGELADRREIS